MDLHLCHDPTHGVLVKLGLTRNKENPWTYTFLENAF
jgi:hypothetical protein